MTNPSDIPEKTRRTVLKTVGAALGVGAAAGSASAHEWGSGSTADGPETGKPSDADVPGGTENASVVGYHSMGSTGGEGRAGRPSRPHYGAQTEIRVRGDYAYVAFFSSDRPTPGRGMAIVDISGYNNASTTAEADTASMSVVSYLTNNSTATAVMDLKVSDDGQYVFLGTQPYTALFPSPTADPVGAATEGEASDPAPNTDAESFSAVPGAVIAVDVSDKGNPQTVGTQQVSGTGVHNLFHHRIGQEEYVFAIHDLNDGTEGMYVYRFDRASGQLELVNQWTATGNARQGELGPDLDYIHDVEVQDDLVTGKPTVYLSYWGNGLRVLDASDPENLVELGHYEMSACHFSSPAPALMETESGTKRVAVASQELSSSETSTGNIHFVDTSGIYEADADELDVPNGADPTANPTMLQDVDTWVWQSEPGEDAAENSRYDSDVDFSNFTLSPHNSDIAVDENGDFWVHQAHYHGGIRYLKMEETTGGLQLNEKGFSRPDYGVPESSRMEGLTSVTPNCWSAVESNGVTFGSDINQGVHAVNHDAIEVGGGPAVADIARSDDGSVFTGGQTDRINLDVQFLDRYESVTVRDRLPSSWDAYDDGEPYDTYTEGGATYVEFGAAASQGDTLSYFADVGEESDGATVGPAEVSTDGGETWQAVPGTLETNFVIGQSTNLLFGTAVATTGVAAHQRDRIADRARELFGRQE